MSTTYDFELKYVCYYIVCVSGLWFGMAMENFWMGSFFVSLGGYSIWFCIQIHIYRAVHLPGLVHFWVSFNSKFVIGAMVNIPYMTWYENTYLCYGLEYGELFSFIHESYVVQLLMKLKPLSVYNYGLMRYWISSKGEFPVWIIVYIHITSAHPIVCV